VQVEVLRLADYPFRNHIKYLKRKKTSWFQQLISYRKRPGSHVRKTT
jgi:hypothetical protein